MSELISQRRRALSLAFQTAVILALVSALYLPVLALLGRMYFQEPRYQHYSHAVLLPVVSLAWVVKERRRLWGIKPEPCYFFGLSTIWAALMLRGGGIVLGVNLFDRLSLVVLLAGVVLFLLGRRMLRALLFPLGYLFLAFPLPLGLDLRIIRYLQKLTASICAIWLEMAGVPLVREGYVLKLPGIDPPLFIAEACSGISSLIALFTLAVGFVFLVERSTRHRVTLVAASVPVAIGVNLARAALTGFLAYHQGAEMALGLYHSLSDLVLFALGLVALLLLDVALTKTGAGGRKAQAGGA
jgi:exosortase